MAGILKVDKYQDFNGNDIMTSDGSGTITMPSGIISGQNYPAFEAVLGSNQTGITDVAYTKVQFDTEVFDTDGCYDNATNYRFTPTVAGKYFVYSFITFFSSANDNIAYAGVGIYKNGTLYTAPRSNYGVTANSHAPCQWVHSVIDLNGTTDYVEIFGQADVASGTVSFLSSNNTNSTRFGAYRIGA